MGRIVNFLILVLFTQVALTLFANSGSAGYTQGLIVGNDSSTGSLTSLFNNPTSLIENPLYGSIFQIFSLAAGLALFVGNFIFRNERFLFIGLTATFASFLYPIAQLWSFMQSMSFSGVLSAFVCSIVILPVIIGGIGVLLDFAQAKD